MAAARPQMKWAQRKDKLFITAEVVKPENVNVEFAAKNITFSGSGTIKVGGDKTDFSVKLNLWNEVDPSQCTYKVVGNLVQICGVKKASGPHWDRMLEEPTRATKQWLGCDWQLWKDEDEEDEKEKIDFGGYGDVSNMRNSQRGAPNPDYVSDSDSDIDTPPANLEDLGPK